MEFSISELVQLPTLILNRQFSSFGPKLPKKGISGPKEIIWTYHRIQHIRISFCAKLVSHTKLVQFCYFDQIRPKRVRKIFIANKPGIPKSFLNHYIHLLKKQIKLVEYLIVLVDSSSSILTALLPQVAEIKKQQPNRGDPAVTVDCLCHLIE